MNQSVYVFQMGGQNVLFQDPNPLKFLSVSEMWQRHHLSTGDEKGYNTAIWSLGLIYLVWVVGPRNLSPGTLPLTVCIDILLLGILWDRYLNVVNFDVLVLSRKTFTSVASFQVWVPPPPLPINWPFTLVKLINWSWASVVWQWRQSVWSLW